LTSLDKRFLIWVETWTGALWVSTLLSRNKVKEEDKKMINRRNFVRLSFAGGVLTVSASYFGKLCAQSNPSIASNSGIVVAIDGDNIYLNTSSGPLTVKTKPSTRIWKGEHGVGLSAIRPQDEVAMRGVTDFSGAFIASEIWVNIVSLDGVIGAVNGDTVDIQVVRNDSISEVKHIRLTNKRLSSQTALLKKENIQVGRRVRVIGLALEDGTIQASRFVVYVNRRPVDSVGTKYVDPMTGKIIDKP